MFRIFCDPSSGSTELCLTEITVVCVCMVRPALMMDHIRSETCQSDFQFFSILSFKLLYNVDFNL